MKTRTCLVLMCVGVLMACNQTTTITPTVSSDEATAQTTNPNINIKVDLPIYLKGVPSLLHPVVVSSVDKYVDKSFSGDKMSAHVDVNEYTLFGQMFNIVFEDIQSGQTKPLFKHNTQLIYRADYPVHTLVEKSENKDAQFKFYGHFVYTVKENTTQSDDDSIQSQKALYLSNDKGGKLQKLHPDGEYVLETRWIPQMERYYFTTKSDSNGDGKITLVDTTHNYYIDFQDVNHPMVKPYTFMPK